MVQQCKCGVAGCVCDFRSDDWCPCKRSQELERLAVKGFDLIDVNHGKKFVLTRCRGCRTVIKVRFSSYSTEAVHCYCRDSSPNKSVGERLLAVVEGKGGKLLDESVFISTARHTFECADGHVWSSTSVLSQGTWCPGCSRTRPRSIDELREVVEKRGGKLKTSEYRGSDSHYEFECQQGHEFTNTFRHVLNRGQWCPTCSKGTKSEEIARACMEALFQEKFPKKRPKWLKNDRGAQMELDGYCEELSLALEYQGIQHYKEISLYPNGNLARRIKDDKRKKRLCEDHGVRLFYFTFEDEYGTFPDITRNQARSFGPEVLALLKNESFDINKAYIREDRIGELRSLLKKKNIHVLDKKWITSDYKYSLECKTCGHKWKAGGNSFFNSRRTTGCSVCAYATNAELMRGNLETLANFASSFGGTVLSSEYVDARSKYEFRCKEGHVFVGKLNNMTSRKQFCPYCEGRASRKFLDSTAAGEKFAEFGYVMVGEFLGSSKPVDIIHQDCSSYLRRSLSSVASSPSCKVCALRAKTDKVLDLWERHNLKSLEAFSGNISKPLKSECLVCGQETSPMPINLMRGQGGCRNCYLMNR